MAKVESKSKQNPKLVQSELQDGRASLALEYYLGRNETPVLDEDGSHVLYTEGAMKGKPKYKIRHIRKREVLNLYIWLHPRNQQERNQNKNTLALAEKIRFEREQEFLEDREGYRLKKDGENDFIKYFRKHWENELYSKPVRCTYKTSCNRFLKFLETTPRFQRYTSYLRMELITPEMVTAFTDYLKKVAKGEGAHKSYYMFRTVILHAIEEGLMKKNPCKGIVIHRDVNTLKKEILTMEEIKRLASTHYEGEDTALKRAFLFCCFTGIRWCDAVSLTYANVDFSARILRFNQQKTEGRSAHSGVTIPLSPALLKLIGNPAQHTSEKIFNITCYRTTAITRLQKWVKAAGINKTITWHCARHSFAVNVLGAGANIKTVASLMGHSSIKCRGVRVYFSNYPHAHLALLHTFKMPKCQKCQGG